MLMRKIVFWLTVLTAPLPLLTWAATSFRSPAAVFASFNVASFAWLLMLLISVRYCAPAKRSKHWLGSLIILGSWPLLVVEVWPSLMDLWFYIGVRLGGFAP